jgi:hypothetical protein
MQLVKGLIKNSAKMEEYLKVMLMLFFLGWNVIEGAVFENEYPYIFVKLYPTPIWRLLLLIALVAGSMWDSYVGIMMAFATFFYVMDMEVTLEKWR